MESLRSLNFFVTFFNIGLYTGFPYWTIFHWKFIIYSAYKRIRLYTKIYSEFQHKNSWQVFARMKTESAFHTVQLIFWGQCWSPIRVQNSTFNKFIININLKMKIWIWDASGEMINFNSFEKIESCLGSLRQILFTYTFRLIWIGAKQYGHKKMWRNAFHFRKILHRL